MATADDLPDIDPDDLAKADAALAGLATAYLSWAENDIRAARACFTRLPGPSGPAALAELYAIVHDMKGQGSTFGYPLVTEIGQALCRLIKTHPAAIGAIETHLAALDLVVNGRLAGDGGEAGRRLLAELGPVNSFGPA